MVHSNPIREIPSSLSNIWVNICEFSLDWMSFLLPNVGKIIKIKSQLEGEGSMIR